MTDLEKLKLKNELFGYKKNNQILRDTKGLEQVEKTISVLPECTRVNLPEISLEEVKSGARTFYGRYFTLHEVATLSVNTLMENQAYITQSTTGAEIAEKMNALCTFKNPFDIPVDLIEGHSMIGETYKPVIICAAPGFKERFLGPFSQITLGNNLTTLSIATYIHEIAHVLTESHIGYTEDFYHKEIISIFLEKVAALELDPSGELLRLSERIRFRNLADLLNVYKNINTIIRLGLIDAVTLFTNSCYIESTLLATKLFDNYQKLRKPQQKEKLLEKIQQIFDGEITVEDLLASERITMAQAKDISLIKRHI